MLKYMNREIFHRQLIFTKCFFCLTQTPPPITRCFCSELHTSFMDMNMDFADLPGQRCVFFDVPEFSFREQFPLKSTHLHLKIYGEQINVSTEILIKG